MSGSIKLTSDVGYDANGKRACDDSDDDDDDDDDNNDGGSDKNSEEEDAASSNSSDDDEGSNEKPHPVPRFSQIKGDERGGGGGGASTGDKHRKSKKKNKKQKDSSDEDGSTSASAAGGDDSEETGEKENDIQVSDIVTCIAIDKNGDPVWRIQKGRFRAGYAKKFSRYSLELNVGTRFEIGQNGKWTPLPWEPPAATESAAAAAVTTTTTTTTATAAAPAAAVAVEKKKNFERCEQCQTMNYDMASGVCAACHWSRGGATRTNNRKGKPRSGNERNFFKQFEP